MARKIQFKKSKEFRVGGYARNRSMGCRIMRVKAIELPFLVILESYGQTNNGDFLPAKRPRTISAPIDSGWYEPVEKVAEG